MTFIIKPLVTEKMTKITDKSSVDKQLRALNEAAAKRHNAEEVKMSYTAKSKNKGTRQLEKTIYKYTKPACRKYGFIVKPEANKLEIKKEIEGMYNVTVLDVNTIRYAGKRQSRYTRSGLLKGQKNAYKKAIVTLKPGDEIDFYSNI
ncbi:MAG: 50S ribosomal protein L23 [Prevotella sp.]|jgi:large subunit ribosomal protein L23